MQGYTMCYVRQNRSVSDQAVTYMTACEIKRKRNARKVTSKQRERERERDGKRAVTKEEAMEALTEEGE